MKFNTLKEGLRRWEQQNEKIDPAKTSGSVATKSVREISTCSPIRNAPVEKVVGGVVRWKPIDKQAAMLLAKAGWLSRPPVEISKPIIEPKPKKNKERKHMVKHASEVNPNTPGQDSGRRMIVLGDYAIEAKAFDKNGEPLFDPVDMWPILLEQINKHKSELTPVALAMIDGERAILSSTKTLKGSMEDLAASSKILLEDLRQTRFSVVSEVSKMTKELRDVRQFFLGHDYKDQIDRLREFVELCERLQKLKESGFLDSVADTMLRLDAR